MLAHLTREFHPLRFSQVAPFACDGSRPVKAASTLGLRLDNRISPICGSSPPGPPRPVCARMAALPIPPFSKWGHGLLIPARLSSRTHIGRTQWTYSIIELSPARTGPPERRRACADWRRCRKSPHFDVHATYSNGDADGPSDTASGYNKESVVTDKIYENGPYRQYFVSGKIRDTSSSGYQYGNEDSPLFK